MDFSQATLPLTYMGLVVIHPILLCLSTKPINDKIQCVTTFLVPNSRKSFRMIVWH